VSTLQVPILVVAGEADSIVPSRLSQQVHDAAPAEARWVLIENAGHNDTDLSFGTPLLDAIDRFLDEVLATNTGG
jgi:pimeloyl-ACP methyl ester carboxylesterase